MVLNEPDRPLAAPLDVLGCLCLPTDVLAAAAMLPVLNIGDVLAFPNAGAYGLSAAPTHFLSHPSPPEVGFDEDRSAVLRPRGQLNKLLDTQSGGEFSVTQQSQDRQSRAASS
jgi:diaminopimelate decarboxylase